VGGWMVVTQTLTYTDFLQEGGGGVMLWNAAYLPLLRET